MALPLFLATENAGFSEKTGIQHVGSASSRTRAYAIGSLGHGSVQDRTYPKSHVSKGISDIARNQPHQKHVDVSQGECAPCFAVNFEQTVA